MIFPCSSNNITFPAASAAPVSAESMTSSGETGGSYGEVIPVNSFIRIFRLFDAGWESSPSDLSCVLGTIVRFFNSVHMCGYKITSAVNDPYDVNLVRFDFVEDPI